MKSPFVALIVMLTPIFLIVSPAMSVQAASTEAMTFDTGAIRLSLNLPRSTYPRNALVRVTVEAQNISKRPQLLYGSTCMGVLSADVLDRLGNVTYSSAGDVVPRCGPVKMVRIAPGVRIRNHVYVVLRNSWVRAAAGVDGRMVLGRAAFVRLTPASGLVMVLRSAPYLHAEVRAPGSRRGAMLYMESSACPSGTGDGVLTGGGTVGWSNTPPYQGGVYWFSPGCDHPARWRLVAGLVGESVVELRR